MRRRVDELHRGPVIIAALALAGIAAAVALTPLDGGAPLANAAWHRAPDDALTYAAAAEPLIATARGAGLALLALAVAALLTAAALLARTPVTVRLVERPRLAVAGLALAVAPWLVWARRAEEDDLTLAVTGWGALGRPCWVAIAGGALLAILATGPPRPWHRLVACVTAVPIAVAFLSGDVAIELLTPGVAVTAIALPLTIVLAARPAPDPAAPSTPATLLLLVAGVALALAPQGLWEIVHPDVPGATDAADDDGVLALIVTTGVLARDLTDVAAIPAALLTVAGVICVAVSSGRLGSLAPRQTGLLLCGLALAVSPWLPVWDPTLPTDAWHGLLWNAWAPFAGGVVLAAAAATRFRRPLLVVPPAVLAILAADGAWRWLPRELPPSGGIVLAVGAASLAVATLLRPPAPTSA